MGPGPRRIGTPARVAAALEENPQCRVGRAAAARQRRRVVQIDLDMRRENERRADVVTGADELFEPPPQDRFSLRLVYQLELGRSQRRLPLGLGYRSQFSVIGFRQRPLEVLSRRTEGPVSGA